MSSTSHEPESFPSPPAEAFPQTWLPYLHDNVFLYGLLPEADQARLRRIVPAFIAAKFWEGCRGLSLTDEMRVTIAAHACLLLLGFDEADHCLADLKTILVYPGGFLCTDSDPLGEGGYLGHHLGEAHHHGPVILSWWHACWDGRHRGHTNLVLHEFAHKLAERGDRKKGLPPLDDSQDEERWDRVLSAEYEQLIEDAEHGRPSLLDPYGASNRTEFFAVATETFFLRPLDLRRLHSELYELLAGWYRQDPATWRHDEATAARTREAEEEYIRHSLAECSAALRARPDYLDAYRRRAAHYCDLKEFANALADCTRLIQLVPNTERADAYYERGCVHLEAESFEQAVADFSEAIRRCRDFAEAFRGRGCAHASLGQREPALADLNRALQLDPRDDAAYLWRGQVWCDAEQHEKAVRDLTRAIRLCPYLADAYRIRARAYLGQGEHGRALADCDEAIRLDPEDAEAYRVRAAVHDAAGDPEKAQRDRAEASRRE